MKRHAHGRGAVAVASGAAAVALTAVFSLPTVGAFAPTADAATDLGGYTLQATAAPLSVLVYDPVIPVPAEPQLEAHLSYTSATLNSGTGRAVASALWPGAAVGEGLPQITGNPDAKYPVQATAAYPGGPETGEQQPGMRAHAEQDTANASVGYGSSASLPSDVPTVPLLAELSGVASQGTSKVSSGKAAAVADTSAGTVSLLGGLVKISGLHVVSQASSDGEDGTATARVTYTGATVLGRELAADRDSVHTPDGSSMSYPQPPAQLRSALAPLGITLGLPSVDRKARGAEASVAGHGPVLTVDTKVLRAKLDPATGALQNAQPDELRQQLDPVFRLAPKIVFILGDTTAAANAAPQADIPSGLGTGGTDIGSPIEGAGAGSTGDPGTSGTGDAQLPVIAGRPAASRSSAGFGGLSPGLLTTAFAVAAVAAWGLRRLNSLIFASGVCESGRTSGVPDLREMWSYVER